MMAAAHEASLAQSVVIDNPHKVAILFARTDSIYKNYDDCDVYDIERDARSFNDRLPVVAHPPCRAWARLRGLAKPREGEKELAIRAVQIIRKNGGVLEHPESSTLFDLMGMPNPLRMKPGQRDEFGGWTLPIQQYAFGHKARKNTWLYICGVAPDHLPSMPFQLGEPLYTIAKSSRSKPHLIEVTKAEREHTPVMLAEWLIEVAKRCERVGND